MAHTDYETHDSDANELQFWLQSVRFPYNGGIPQAIQSPAIDIQARHGFDAMIAIQCLRDLEASEKASKQWNGTTRGIRQDMQEFHGATHYYLLHRQPELQPTGMCNSSSPMNMAWLARH